VALRSRLQDGRELLTLKGPSTTDGALFSRDELEVPADAAGRKTIRDELAHAGVRLATATPAPADTNDWLEQLGLGVTLQRHTSRRVMLAHQGNEPLVELALDTTTFQLRMYDVVFREIEAEALGPDGADAQAIGVALLENFSGRLEPSTRGKYGRGLYLAELLD
jgi:inorganic triphosphatase YgiF